MDGESGESMDEEAVTGVGRGQSEKEKLVCVQCCRREPQVANIGPTYKPKVRIRTVRSHRVPRRTLNTWFHLLQR